jgi:hypothetical protein
LFQNDRIDIKAGNKKYYLHIQKISTYFTGITGMMINRTIITTTTTTGMISGGR